MRQETRTLILLFCKMETKSNTINRVLFLALAIGLLVSFAGVVSATCYDAGIRYNYADTFGTGIGISENGSWLDNPIVLAKNKSHEIKFRVENNVNFSNKVNIIIKVDGSMKMEYDKTINANSYTSKKLDFDISQLECNSTHTISLEVYNESDCNTSDNYASRDFYVMCNGGGIENNETNNTGNETQAYCGDGVVNQQTEECDDGNNYNGDGCSSTCREETQEQTQTGKSVGISPDITTEDFKPKVWMCDHRVVYDDATEPGRVSLDGDPMIERIHNYAFEGEQISWKVLVMDKNGIDKVSDVYATIGGVQGEGNDIEANCKRINDWPRDQADLLSSCNARIGEEEIDTFDSDMMSYYECTLTVETPESMYGEYFTTVEATDLDGLMGTMDENEYWFFNPTIALSVNGDLAFDNVRPGTDSYSDTILVGNDADDGSGVLLDMFISGTDFYDSSSSGAKCPTTNQLSLGAFRYYVTNGAYNSAMDDNLDSVDGDRNTDAEGYTNIDYGIGFNNPDPFYDNMEILQTGPAFGPYWTANTLSPGSEMALTFKLSLPEPCNGDFDTGSIYFWGEAI